MHCTFRAPELSATSSMERGWIIALPSPEWSGCASASPWRAGASPRSPRGPPTWLSFASSCALSFFGHADDPGSADDGRPARSAPPRLLHGIAHHDAPHDSCARPRLTLSLSSSSPRPWEPWRPSSTSSRPWPLAGLRLLGRWGRHGVDAAGGRRRHRHRHREGSAAALALDRVARARSRRAWPIRDGVGHPHRELEAE